MFGNSSFFKKANFHSHTCPLVLLATIELALLVHAPCRARAGHGTTDLLGKMNVEQSNIPPTSHTDQ